MVLGFFFSFYSCTAMYLQGMILLGLVRLVTHNARICRSHIKILLSPSSFTIITGYLTSYTSLQDSNRGVRNIEDKLLNRKPCWQLLCQLFMFFNLFPDSVGQWWRRAMWFTLWACMSVWAIYQICSVAVDYARYPKTITRNVNIHHNLFH